MTPKPVVPRLRASQDVEDIVQYYLDEHAVSAALGFIDALEKAYRHIGSHPALGSPRYAHELGLPDLRMWALQRYPQIIFYREQPDHIDVWRVLHDRRDIPVRLREL